MVVVIAAMLEAHSEQQRRRVQWQQYQASAGESDRGMKNEDDTWYWGKQMIACFEELRGELAQHRPPVVDREIMPQFSGSPDDMFLWLICDRGVDVPKLKSIEGLLKSRIQARMETRGFPTSAVDSLQVGSTSLEDIEKGGGRFHYFR